MLNVSDLINIQYIPDISEISLSLLVDFYEQYLCKRIFVFELADGYRLKLFFKDTSEIFHVSGIDHIYENIPMDGTRFVEGIKNNTINFSVLENVNRAAYTDYLDRIRSIACIDTILKNCEYLWFTEGKIPDSTIKVSYLLLKGIGDKNLHLGIDSYKEGRPYFSRTLLVTDGKGMSKYIDKATERLRVTAIKIIDKDTNNIIDNIDRVAAVNKADEMISIIAKQWNDLIFPGLYNEYKERFGNISPNSRKKKEWISKLFRYLEDNKDTIRKEVEVYDPYWTAKIVAEQIRVYIKNKAIGCVNCLVNT